MAIQYKLREFTVEEYHWMAEVGVLRAEELVELLDGAIVEMSSIGTRHWGRHLDVVEYLIRTLGETAKIAGQSSLSLGTRDEPQPDIAVLAPKAVPAVEPAVAVGDIRGHRTLRNVVAKEHRSEAASLRAPRDR